MLFNIYMLLIFVHVVCLSTNMSVHIPGTDNTQPEFLSESLYHQSSSSCQDYFQPEPSCINSPSAVGRKRNERIWYKCRRNSNGKLNWKRPNSPLHLALASGLLYSLVVLKFFYQQDWVSLKNRAKVGSTRDCWFNCGQNGRMKVLTSLRATG